MGRFRRTFEVTGGELLVSDDEPVPSLGEGEHRQEGISRYGGEGEPAAPVNPQAASEE